MPALIEESRHAGMQVRFDCDLPDPGAIPVATGRSAYRIVPGVDGLAATERLRARQNAPQVIVLTTFDADDYVLRALRAGAAGFLMKDTPPPDIMRAIRLVVAGEAMLSPTVTRRLIEHVADDGLAARRARAARPAQRPRARGA